LITFDYQSVSKDMLSSRKVLPHKLYLQNGNLYLSGYDWQAQSDRIFKADQILNCVVGEKSEAQKFDQLKDEEVVELTVNPENLNFIERNSSIIIEQVISQGQLLVKLRVSNFDWLKRAILSNAPSIKVVSPRSLALEVEQMASNLVSAYSDQS
jgi:predicted DNA-binding transcriptional regulator YafY